MPTGPEELAGACQDVWRVQPVLGADGTVGNERGRMGPGAKEQAVLLPNHSATRGAASDFTADLIVIEVGQQLDLFVTHGQTSPIRPTAPQDPGPSAQASARDLRFGRTPD